MSDDTQQPIIVRRVNKGHGAHHGGAWKIAYADFVTAMMAFFLLLWLLGSTSKEDLKGISQFFQNPSVVSQQGGTGAGDSSSIIPGGGQDLTRSVGQVRRGDLDPERRQIPLDATMPREARESASEDEKARERAQLLNMKGRIEALIEANPNLRSFRNQILIDITSEGLRIQLVDEQNRPMFDLSSAELRPHTRELLRAIGRALNDLPNRLSLSGHTDAKPFAGGERGFSNWELSANRANASRRELIAGGLEPTKVLRVVGQSDMIPFNPDDPFDPSNRRIAIVVMNKTTEEAVLGTQRQDGVNVGSQPEPGGVLDGVQRALER
ncbi:MAG: flagellar motor protein MotB [Zoogloeaceae bacterium]|nr:flagellar motor protein MotB [Zoogloeaceae bacterium]